jgi:hypothetical protein
MLTAFFDLREDDIQKLKLNDKIRIDNSWWTINKVIDYDCNAQNLTKVELMSVDTEIDLAPFAKGSVTPTTVGDLASHTGSIHFNNSFVGNVIPSTSTSAIYGQGNVIQPGVNGIIVGNGKMLDQTGIVTERLGADVAKIASLAISEGLQLPIAKTTVDYYLTTNNCVLICVNITGAINVYLPKANAENIGQVFIIKGTNGFTNTIYPFGTDVIDTAISYSLTSLSSVRLLSNGATAWIII